MKGILDVINSTDCVFMNDTSITAQHFFWSIHKVANVGRSSALFQLVTIMLTNFFQMFYLRKRMTFRRNYRFVIFNTVSDVIMSGVMIISFCLQSCVVLHINCEKKENIDSCEPKGTSNKNVNHTLSFISNTAIMSSTWAVVIISCDRLRAIRYPLKGKRSGLLGNTRTTIALIIIIIVLTNVSRYWESNTVLRKKMYGNSTARENEFIDNFDRLRITFMAIRIFIHVLLPSFILIVTNIMLVNHIQSRKITFERVKWNLISKSFELESSGHQKRNTIRSFFLPCKSSSKENRITTSIILMITIHIISFTPTILYNTYFEVIFPLAKIYFNIHLPSWNATLAYKNEYGFNLRRDIAYIPIFILFIGKIVNTFLMSNMSDFFFKNYHKLFFWKLFCKRKYSNTSINRKDSSLNQRKVTRVYYSNIKQLNCNETVNFEVYSQKPSKLRKNTN